MRFRYSRTLLTRVLLFSLVVIFCPAHAGTCESRLTAFVQNLLDAHWNRAARWGGRSGRALTMLRGLGHELGISRARLMGFERGHDVVLPQLRAHGPDPLTWAARHVPATADGLITELTAELRARGLGVAWGGRGSATRTGDAVIVPFYSTLWSPAPAAEVLLTVMHELAHAVLVPELSEGTAYVDFERAVTGAMFADEVRVRLLDRAALARVRAAGVHVPDDQIPLLTRQLWQLKDAGAPVSSLLDRVSYQYLPHARREARRVYKALSE